MYPDDVLEWAFSCLVTGAAVLTWGAVVYGGYELYYHIFPTVQVLVP